MASRWIFAILLVGACTESGAPGDDDNLGWENGRLSGPASPLAPEVTSMDVSPGTVVHGGVLQIQVQVTTYNPLKRVFAVVEDRNGGLHTRGLPGGIGGLPGARGAAIWIDPSWPTGALSVQVFAQDAADKVGTSNLTKVTLSSGGSCSDGGTPYPVDLARWPDGGGYIDGGWGTYDGGWGTYDGGTYDAWFGVDGWFTYDAGWGNIDLAYGGG